MHVWRDSFACVTFLLYYYCPVLLCDMTRSMCDMTHSYMRHVSFACETWLICMCDFPPLLSLSRAVLFDMCDMTHLCVWRDSFIKVTWLFHMCNIPHSHVCMTLTLPCCAVWQDSFICVTWLIHICAVTHSYVWHDSFIRAVCTTHSHVLFWKRLTPFASSELLWCVAVFEVCCSMLRCVVAWCSVL